MITKEHILEADKRSIEGIDEADEWFDRWGIEGEAFAECMVDWAKTLIQARMQANEPIELTLLVATSIAYGFTAGFELAAMQCPSNP